MRLIHEHGYGEARTVYVHASTLSADSYAGIAATGGSVSVSTESEQSAGLVRNDDSPAMTPLLNPHGHVVLHAQRADVDAVLVDGRIVKRDHRLVGADLAGARRAVEATHGDPVVKR
ncbi:hypothetical protein ACFWIW_10220 [Amycolatopsis sp. NPDC058340]|uniref:hypothetical protein n=1 Tax=Amycolatopsis sp. NPDC058340 TaxID=3346453 RepID=UPI0036581013